MTAVPEQHRDENPGENQPHPRDIRVVRDHHGNPLPGTGEPDAPDDPHLPP
jgi:hypothetical protein